ncbi:VWA domain-containing protein [Bacillus sp. C28GYM-DRY-1]|uniref:VWA domain-containing protein n=1 Tax=Bacillus sp. C28GYM-DRY-1 TaxID=3062686 RepID=UPI0026769DF3|nr:VWA domain-containing protein [Bacillus sp. C28GYM-DRY-1]MDO3660446.1 VWA domain-containing protein [Bacillus sp. C28GYM-DRY-1]
MNKLQEIKARISKLKGYENAKPTDQYWMDKEHIDFLIDRTELSVKQQEIIEENKRQQEVTVHQFRQAQKDIQHLSGDRKRYKQALEKIITNLTFAITVAQNELEGDVK